MNSFAIKGNREEIREILSAFLKMEQHPTIPEQVEILEENEIIRTEAGEKEFNNYYRGVSQTNL